MEIFDGAQYIETPYIRRMLLLPPIGTVLAPFCRIQGWYCSPLKQEVLPWRRALLE
jgi:hypothetical protein